MIKLCCDICGEPINSYTDNNGHIWDDFTIRERKTYKPKILIASWQESWWDEFHVCGKCRKALAEYKGETDEHMEKP